MKKHTLLLGLSLLSFAAITPAQEARDPFAADVGNEGGMDAAPEPKRQPNITYPQVLSICYESFSLSLTDAAALQREALSDAQLYQKLVEGLKEGSVKQVTFVVVRTHSGQRATSESIVEEIYPTEWEPPELPNQVGVNLTGPATKEKPNPPIEDDKLARLQMAAHTSELPDLISPATPTAFEARSLGFTWEVDAILSEDDSVIDIRTVPEHVFMVGRSNWGQDESTIELPEFETSRTNTSITAPIGKPSLIGTINRPPQSKIDTDAANKVWFAFITPSIVVINP